MQQTSAPEHLADHLFRREAGKMIAMLTNAYGAQHLQMAEDVVQDTLMQACISWQEELPPNPEAWLYRTARNKAIDALRKASFSQSHDFSDGSSHYLHTANDVMDEGLHEELIADDMLRMMYACCHPEIPQEGATALILKTLCGFSTAEIAGAFLTSEDTISKRLYRAKEGFRQGALKLDITSVAALKSRTDAVLRAIYLLFNEGYHSTQQQSIIRNDLMEDAMRLCAVIIQNPRTQQPPTFALMALMCFQASRSDSRLSPEGDIILLEHQDRSKWNAELIAQGNDLMNRAATGDEAGVYHLQAAIASEHCNAATFDEIDWHAILKYYDWLKALAPSPVVELHRAVALLYAYGADDALAALATLKESGRIGEHYLFYAVSGECYAVRDDHREATACFERAAALTHLAAEKALLKHKIAALYA